MTIARTTASDLVAELARLNAGAGQGWPVVSRTTHATVPFFGDVLCEERQTAPDDDPDLTDTYYNIVRRFGWAVTVGITTDGQALLLAQWKPGMNEVGLELAPGGIGKVEGELPDDEILRRTQDALTRETGYGRGRWSKTGVIRIESGKYRGVTADSHGLFAHLFLATGLVPVREARHANNEKIHVRLIPAEELLDLVLGGHFTEESAVAAIFHAAVQLGWLVLK